MALKYHKIIFVKNDKKDYWNSMPLSKAKKQWEWYILIKLSLNAICLIWCFFYQKGKQLKDKYKYIKVVVFVLKYWFLTRPFYREGYKL